MVVEDRVSGGTEHHRQSFAAALQAQRIAKQMTQEQLAAASRISVRSLSSLEQGKVRRPRPDTIRRLVAGLGLSGPVAVELETLAHRDYWVSRRRITEADADKPPPPEGPPAGEVTAGAGRSTGPVPVPAQLPPAPAAFVGRMAERGRLNRWLPGEHDPPAVLCVSGPPGVGKTGLAVHWAHQVRDRFPDGQLHLDLRGREPDAALTVEQALAHLLHGLSAPEARSPSRVAEVTALYRTLTAGRRLLVLLDDAVDATQVRPLLPTGPGSVTVVTSRGLLDGLVVREGARRLSVSGLLPSDAILLIHELLGPETTGEDPRAAAELAELCDYLPLALRLAAAHLLDRLPREVDAYCRALRVDRLGALSLPDDAVERLTVPTTAADRNPLLRPLRHSPASSVGRAPGGDRGARTVLGGRVRDRHRPAQEDTGRHRSPR